MLSGYAHAFKNRYNVSYLTYLKKYAIDLYLPCIYFSVVYWGLKYFLLQADNSANFHTVSLKQLYLIPFQGFNVYWFLCELFFIKMLHTVLECKIRSVYFISVVLLALFLFSYFFCKSMETFTIRCLYFHAGYLLRRMNYISQAKHPPLIFGLILFQAGLLCFIADYFFSCSNIFTGAGAAFFMSIALFIIFYAVCVKNKILRICGLYSMVIYCLHDYIFAFLRIVFNFLPLSAYIDPFLLFSLCLVLSVCLPVLFALAYTNLKCFRWIEYIFYPGKLLLKK